MICEASCKEIILVQMSCYDFKLKSGDVDCIIAKQLFFIYSSKGGAYQTIFKSSSFVRGLLKSRLRRFSRYIKVKRSLRQSEQCDSLVRLANRPLGLILQRLSRLLDLKVVVVCVFSITSLIKANKGGTYQTTSISCFYYLSRYIKVKQSLC